MDPSAIMTRPQRVTGQGRAARRPVRRLVFAGLVPMAAVVAAAALVLAVNGNGEPAGSGRPEGAATGGTNSAAPATAELILISAAKATAQTSFRMTIAYSISDGHSQDVTERYTGAYDPASRKGVLDHVDGKGPRIRIDGDRYYVWRGEWRYVGKTLSDAIGIVGVRAAVGMNELTVDPASLFNKLRGLGTVANAGRSAGVDTYTYTFGVKGVATQGEPADVTVAGTAQVDVGSNRLTSVTEQTTFAGPNPGIADRNPVTFRTVVQFSDYGTVIPPVGTSP
jgi:hypothetical protein